ncbi:ABC transporter permease subunit [Paenibacillus thalictri]|nr:ABC transporter permease subunit [Paenibacillus thalictri]
MLPILAWFCLFSYYPMARGIIISFQEYRLIGNRPFIGFKNYMTVLNDSSFWDAFTNTFVIGSGILVLGFVMPIVLALSLNEVFQTWFKKLAQTIVYIPHLFSWIVVGGMWIMMLSPDTGIVNQLLHLFGTSKPINFMTDSTSARWVMILSYVWKDMGYFCILYLATIVSINPALYEAARIDGANRWDMVRFVTVPQLFNTMKVVVMLNVLNVLKIFEQVVAMRNGAVAKKVDVLMMYTYQKGILEFKIGVATAGGFILIITTLIIVFAVRLIIRYDEG